MGLGAVRLADIYIDTNVFIRCFESGEAEAAPLQDLFIALRERPGSGITSELTIAELFAPAKRFSPLASAERRELYSALLLSSSLIDLRAVTLDILLATPTLRQAFNHKLADAIHIATAEQAGCSLFLSGDRDATRLPASLRHLRPDGTGVRVCLEVLARGSLTL